MDLRPSRIISSFIKKQAIKRRKKMDEKLFALVFAYGMLEIFGFFQTVFILGRLYARSKKSAVSRMRDRGKSV